MGDLSGLEYPMKYSLEWFSSEPSHGGFGIFSTGSHRGMGTTCVESEICNEKYQEKNTTLVDVLH